MLIRRAPARCGAFADERRIVVGMEAASEDAKRLIRVPRAVRREAIARLELKLITPSSGRRAHRHLPSRFARALRRVRQAGARMDPRALHTGVRIATFRCGAFADERRFVVATKPSEVRHRRACASLVALRAAGGSLAGLGRLSGQGSRRSILFRRLEREWMNMDFTPSGNEPVLRIFMEQRLPGVSWTHGSRFRRRLSHA